MDRYETYANTIVKDLLSLRVGDALSINTDEKDVEFAKTIARTALPITDVTVKIVVIEKGKPHQVLEFDPQPPAHLPTGYAMLRLSHKGRRTIEGKILDIVVEPTDMGAIQKLGHLAEPVVLGRRIAVPWCVVDVFDEDDIESWQALERKISYNIANLGLVSEYRMQRLNESEIVSMRISGEETDFSFDIPEQSLFCGGNHELSSGRQFLSSMDFDRLSFLVDRKSANGFFTADVEVLGKSQRVRFEFEDGYLTSHSPSAELDRLLSFDDNLRRVGYISLMDKEIIVYLGGAVTDALRILPSSEEELPDFFNTSLYTLRCVLPSDCDVDATDLRGIGLKLMTDGLYTE